MSTAPTHPLPPRLVSLDAYRGLTMLAMASGGLGLHRVAENMRKSGHDSPFWEVIGYQFEHVDWVGCAAWDLIQPSFMFMVGVAMAYSCASRQARGQSWGQMFRHAAVRSVVLVALGIFLRSDGRDQTYFTFEDVLTQIGLGYTFLFLLWNRPTWVQLVAAFGILAGYWALFYLYPLPPADFDYSAVGVGPDWPHLEGVGAHWDKNTNAAHYFDTWFLNLFPRKELFAYNGGGYLTLSFVPSLATMIFGLISGELLRGGWSQSRKFLILVLAGIVGLAAGWGWQQSGWCPIVKRIWTPSWTLFSTGWTCLILAAFFGVVDILGFRKWTFPLVVVGMNSITTYVLAELSKGWFYETIKTHFGEGIFGLLGPDYEPFLAQVFILLAIWLFLYWLYRQRVFIRI